MAKKNSATFESLNPVNGDVAGTYPIHNDEDVYAAVTLASDAAIRWVALGHKGRRKVLLEYGRLILREIDSLAEQVTLETGKPHSDAKLEITLAAHHVAWAARNAESVLRTAHRSPGALMANMSATVERSPLGVVGVIGPWNYPVFTPIGSIAYALAAGNTVVFKPSEYTPGVGIALADLFEHVAGSSEYFQVVTGFGETGAALCRSGVKKLAFTGSTATAKKVAALCAETLTPVIAECGGKDPVIVARDADISRAADAAVWSAFSNAGQTCIGAERVYVDENIADIFTEKVIALAKDIHAGDPADANYGPATMPSQLKIIESHIKDAVKRGGIPVVGGTQSVGGRFVQPVVLLQVPEDSIAVTDETFGPTLVINRVPDMETAIELANASRYGLGASVWSRRQGRAIASQLQCGMVAINSVISFAAVASIPFGGIKDSGYGRIHGPEGLLEFTYARSVVRAKFQLPLAITSFKRTAKIDGLVVGLLKALRGRLS
jgi:acyl-CoA reductase-like NAD-dependent aldehyde dehydrogenase